MKNNSFKNLSVLENKWINNNDDDDDGGDDDDDDCDENNEATFAGYTGCTVHSITSISRKYYYINSLQIWKIR